MTRLRIRRKPEPILPVAKPEPEPKPEPLQYGVAYSSYRQGYVIFGLSIDGDWLLWNQEVYDSLGAAQAACPAQPISLPFSFLNTGSNWDR